MALAFRQKIDFLKDCNKVTKGVRSFALLNIFLFILKLLIKVLNTLFFAGLLNLWSSSRSHRYPQAAARAAHLNHQRSPTPLPLSLSLSLSLTHTHKHSLFLSLNLSFSLKPFPGWPPSHPAASEVPLPTDIFQSLSSLSWFAWLSLSLYRYLRLHR